MKYIVLSFAGLSLAFICGCTTGGAQPSRSQSQNNEFNRCNITINIGARKASTVANGAENVTTNEVDIAASEYAERAAVEWFTLNQNQAGSESITPTQTNTTDTKPDIDVTVPLNKGSSVASGASGVAGAVGVLASAAAQGIANAVSDNSTGTATAKAATANADCVDCQYNGGNGTVCEDCTPE